MCSYIPPLTKWKPSIRERPLGHWAIGDHKDSKKYHTYGLNSKTSIKEPKIFSLLQALTLYDGSQLVRGGK